MAFSLPALREEVKAKLKVEPCEWQLEAIRVIRDNQHAVVIAPTGGGKTLPLTAPILLEDDGITLIVSALNVITSQIVTKLGGKQGGILELHGASNNVDISTEDKNFALSSVCRCVVLPPEVLVSANFKPILESKEWRTRLRHVRVDECHCITTWASFRPEFRRFEFLTDQFPHVLFYFTSATITERQENHIQVLFGLKKEDTKVIRLSNERTNVQIVIIDMVYPSMTHKDLLRFLHPLPSARNPCRPFLIYVNSISEAESAATFLCAVLKEIDPAIEDKVTWVHSLSSKEHLDRVVRGLVNGDYWGVVSTEILGMGADIPGLLVGGQWGRPPSLHSLVQRMGRLGRSTNETATFYIFVPKPTRAETAKAQAHAKDGTSVDDAIQIEDDVIIKEEPEDDNTDLLNPGPLVNESEVNKGEGSSVKVLKNRNVVSDAVRQREEKEVNDFLKSPDCARKHLNEFFSNPGSSPYTCSCGRCRQSNSLAPNLCCSKCTPSLLIVPDDLITVTNDMQRNRRRVRKGDLTDQERFAMDALDVWARQVVKDDFGFLYGGSIAIIWPEISMTFVKLMRTQVLQSVDDIKRETSWVWADMYGEAVLGILSRHLPPQTIESTVKKDPLATFEPTATDNIPSTSTLPVPTTSTGTGLATASDRVKKARAPAKCRNCGDTDHDVRRCAQPCKKCMSPEHTIRNCPSLPAKVPRPQTKLKENTSMPTSSVDASAPKPLSPSQTPNMPVSAPDYITEGS